jgi:FlaA1/EpsC-like NDP-sugar epimerase
MIISKVRNRHLFALDIALIVLAAYGSFVLRLETFDPGQYELHALVFVIVAAIVAPLVFWLFGVYSRYWQYASVDEMMLLASASLVAAIATTLVSYLIVSVLSSERIPLSVPLIFLLLMFPAVMLSRYVLRVFPRRRMTKKSAMLAQHVLIFGAGEAGSMMVRELQRNPHLGLTPVAFVDDDPYKQKLSIHGVPVAGTRHDIPYLVAQHDIVRVIIAIPTASGSIVRDVKEICDSVDVSVKIIPGVYELLDGSVSVNQLRDVDIEDLLRREPVQTDDKAVFELIKGRRILITGGGGSIGGELCRQIWRSHPAMLILVGHGENSVFDMQRELLLSAESLGIDGKSQLQSVIADIRFPERLDKIFAQYQPEIVFHAAAHKHVPLMELNPAEAVTNNIIGTRNLVDVSVAHGVERFIMISTDKAVNPTNMMGASKRMAELIVLRAAREHGLPYVTVRFGNVLGSRGSVVLTFKKQIASGGPITVTDPEMTRYFMTIPEAVQLVLQAAVLGKGGEIFVLDMGEPVKIVDMANDLIELSGLTPGEDIEIIFTGCRPGEKLYEELFMADEEYERTHHKKVFIATNGSSFVPGALDSGIDALQDAASRNDRAAIYSQLQQLLPEFSPINPPVNNAQSDRSIMQLNKLPQREYVTFNKQYPSVASPKPFTQ